MWRTESSLARNTPLTRAIPKAEQVEVHSRLIHAPVGAVWDALVHLSLLDLPAARVLMWMRAAGRNPAASAEPMLTHGPVPAQFLRPPHYAAGVKAHRPWSRTGGPAVSLDTVTSVPAGWIVTGTDFLLEPQGDDTRITTTTRCLATDAASRRAMGLYWGLIGVPSGLIRREMLRTIARKSQAWPRQP